MKRFYWLCCFCLVLSCLFAFFCDGQHLEVKCLLRTCGLLKWPHEQVEKLMFWAALSLLFSFTLNRHSSLVSLENSPPPNAVFVSEIVSSLYLSISLMFTIFVSRFSVYSGHHTILIPPGDLETNPALWLSVVSQYKGNNCVCHSRGYYCIPRVSFQSQNVSTFRRYLGLTDAQFFDLMWIVIRSQSISGLRRRLDLMRYMSLL